MICPECNGEFFQTFLDQLSESRPDTLIVLLLDNGKFHKGKKLVIPNNIRIIFQPPYSPELNPSEKIWWKLKRDFTNRNFETLEEVEKFMEKGASSLTNEQVKSICSFRYFFEE